MTHAPIVAVRGEVFREVDPELASFTVTVSARDKDRQTTLTQVTARHDAVRGLFDQYAAAIERRETGAVVIHPENKGRGERIAAYAGSISTKVTITDFALLGELMLRLADQDQTSVYGPFWSLRPTSQVYAEARRAAVAEAIERAREYAAALGAQVTRLIELADAGLSAGAEPRPEVYGVMQTMSYRGVAEQPQLNLDPQRQTVRAQIEARFAISEPTTLRD
jgi:uncharacterized protein